jgi:hypothetical protein
MLGKMGTNFYCKDGDVIHTKFKLKNGRKNGHVIPENIENKSSVKAMPITDDLFGPKTIKGVLLSTKNSVMKLGLVIK